MIRTAECSGSNLVFVVGCPRSGTTWLQRLLAAHPDVRTGQESGLFMFYLGPQCRRWRADNDATLSGRGGVGLACYFTEAEFSALLREYMFKLLAPMTRQLGTGQIFLEKSPSHALFLPEIHQLLPEARIIHVLRDGRDVVASLVAASKTWGANWAPRRARRAAAMWMTHVQAVRESAPRFGKDQFFEIRYEQLHDSPIRVLRSVVDFLGLEWENEAIRQSVDANRAVLVAAGGGTPIPVYGEAGTASGGLVREPPGFVRKARPGAWREDLSWPDRIAVWQAMRRSMGNEGYSWRLP